MRGVIPPAWREIRVVFIPKPGPNLTITKSWRLLNLINCVGKLEEKVVADRIQDFGGELFHHLQFGSVWEQTSSTGRWLGRESACR